MQPAAPPVTPQKPAIQVIERMNALLDVLARQDEPVALKALAQGTGLHPSTAHRILNDLVLARMVDRTEPGFISSACAYSSWEIW